MGNTDRIISLSSKKQRKDYLFELEVICAIHLETPDKTLQTYYKMGDTWVDDMRGAVDESMKNKLDEIYKVERQIALDRSEKV